MSSDTFNLLKITLVNHKFLVNRHFTPDNVHEFMTDLRTNNWFSMSMSEIYTALHSRYNGNAEAYNAIMTRLLTNKRDLEAHVHIVGVSALWLLYVYTHCYCRSRSVDFSSPLIAHQLQQSFESIVRGTWTANKTTGEPIWEGPLAETIEPEHTVFDCLDYWCERQSAANKDHAMGKFIDVTLINNEIARGKALQHHTWSQ